jgi:Bifunctional DNA primase/polymerase, N-terminal
MSTLHTAALQLAERGLAVFPCQPRGKAPACDAGLHAATTDPERINRWCRAFPDFNIGIATGAASRVFVLDIDGDDGEASLRKLEGEHSALPELAAREAPPSSDGRDTPDCLRRSASS